MYIYIFLLRMTDTVTFHNIDLSSWDIVYRVRKFVYNCQVGSGQKDQTTLRGTTKDHDPSLCHQIIHTSSSSRIFSLEFADQFAMP
jgi:hypothetical protein